MKFYFENNFWAHVQMDFDSIFKNRHMRIYSSFDDLLDRNKDFKKQNLYHFPVAPDDKTIGYNFLLSKYEEPYEYKRGSMSKVVNYRNLGAYSLDADLGVPPALDATREEVVWTINNTNVTMPFSKYYIELYEECGTLYGAKLIDDKELYKIYKSIRNKYDR